MQGLAFASTQSFPQVSKPRSQTYLTEAEPHYAGI